MYDVIFDPPIEDIQKRIQALEDELKTKAVASGLSAAGRLVKAAMVKETPKDTGALKASMAQRSLAKTFKQRLGYGPLESVVLVGPLRKYQGEFQGWKMRKLEAGARPHVIKPKEGDGALSLKGGAVVEVVNHPGFTAIPIRQRALDASSGGIQQAFYKGLDRHLKRKGF